MPLADATLLGTLGTIGVLILLEGLLSADNALVIALLVKHLPPKERRRALLVGLVGSFTFRFAAILLATRLMEFWYLQAAGALYLFYLPIKHFLLHRKQKKLSGEPAKPRKMPGFWQTVALVEFTDLIFAIDSILVAVSLSDVTWIIWLGGISGVVLLRFAAFFLVKVMDKLPGLEHMAYALVGWVAVKLSFMAAHSYSKTMKWRETVDVLNPAVFWVGMGVIVAAGIFLARRGAKPDDELAENVELLEDVTDGLPDSVDEKNAPV
ncbi:MAG: TerC family protein [Armatimonadota bacterium]|nr:TerC family protein [Armatimonadota bacterium]